MRDRNIIGQVWERPVWASVQSSRAIFGTWRRRWANARRWGGFALALRDSLRHPISVEDARAIIRQRLVDREANFLQMVERNIFGHPRSPYLSLLKLAGCELGDIRSMIRSTGLENTLRSLRQAGVYIAFEEFKGRQPIVRNGLVMHVQPEDFNNPYIHNYFEAQTGGTTGTASRVPIDLSRIASQVSIELLMLAAHDLVDVPAAIWRTVYGGYGLTVALRAAHFRWPLRRWFSPTVHGDFNTSKWNRLNTFLILMSRISGASIPWPTTVRLDEAVMIAHWAARTLAARKRCVIRTSVSQCTRIAIAAHEEGLDLTGATFLGGGEPPTPAKIRHITACGARWVPHYNFAEAGYVGIGCTNPVDENDMHFARDSLALIQYLRQVPGCDIMVDAFNFTTLLPTATRVLLNVESDDYGVIEQRRCGCLLEEEGLTDHIREVRSFQKLTGEGMTLVGSDMVRILEEVLPARFGGSLLDYQLLEEEEDAGFTRLTLLVDPSIEIRDDNAVIDAVLGSLSRGTHPPVIWRQARTLRVRRTQPVWTARGKLMPLHIAGRRSTKTI